MLAHRGIGELERPQLVVTVRNAGVARSITAFDRIYATEREGFNSIGDNATIRIFISGRCVADRLRFPYPLRRVDENN